MTIALDQTFIRSAQREPYTLLFDERTITLRATTAQTYGALAYAADLEVVEGDEVLGYITPYSSNEHGAVKANLFGLGAPRLFRTLDDALRDIL